MTNNNSIPLMNPTGYKIISYRFFENALGIPQNISQQHLKGGLDLALVLYVFMQFGRYYLLDMTHFICSWGLGFRDIQVHRREVYLVQLVMQGSKIYPNNVLWCKIMHLTFLLPNLLRLQLLNTNSPSQNQQSFYFVICWCFLCSFCSCCW